MFFLKVQENKSVAMAVAEMFSDILKTGFLIVNITMYKHL